METPLLLLFSLSRKGTLCVDAAYAINCYKVGIWALFLGGKIFKCSTWDKNQQEAELEALVRGVKLCDKIGWPVLLVVGDNWSALEQISSFRARSGIRRKKRHL